MVPLATQLVLQIAFLGTAGLPVQTYRDAYYQAERQQQPLLVLVGDESSPRYRKMKAELLPALARDGALKEIAVAIVDSGKHPKMAKRILQGDAAAQLVLYTRAGETWQRSQLSAADSVTEVRTFIEQNINAASNTTAEPTYTIPVQWGSS